MTTQIEVPAGPTTGADNKSTTFTRAALEQRSGAGNEPAWLRERRSAAFASYEQLPMPSPFERAWKYLNPQRLRLDGLQIGGASGDAAAPAPAGETDEATSARVTQVDGGAVTVALDEAVRAQGVIVAPLAQAAQDHEELVRRSLGLAVRDDESIFATLNAAFWGDGLFIYVPKGVQVAAPVHLALEQRTDGLALFPRLLVVLERDASVTLVEERIGNGDLGGFCAGVSEFIVGDGARLNHYAVQRWGSRMQDISTQRALLGKDARSTTLTAGLGGEVTKWWVDAEMTGSGSESVMLGVFFATGRQHFDVITLQDHIGEHTTSDLLYKSVLKDRSVSAYYGLTRVGPEARGTAANQEDRNLLLSPKAKADADPVLEIMTSDVIRCGHGASAGPVDPEQLFYLECRGLPRPEAEKLLVQGFLHQVNDRIPLQSVRDTIDAQIQAKLGALA